MDDDDESITIDVTEHPVTDEQKAGWEMSYCDKHQVYWVLDEGSCPSCERGAKPISYGKDRNGGVRAIYIHGVKVVGAMHSVVVSPGPVAAWTSATPGTTISVWASVPRPWACGW